MGACAVWLYLAMLGTKRECVRVAKHHLFGHSLKGASFLFQHFAQADAVGICCWVAHGVVPPFLNGRAVFANKHALALAHASGGGKCKRRVPYPECNGGRRRRSAQAERGRLGCFLRAPGTESLPCLFASPTRTNPHTASFSFIRAVAFVPRFPSGREPGGVQRQSLKLPYAGWLPHERVSSQACLGLSAGVGRNSGPRGSRGSP